MKTAKEAFDTALENCQITNDKQILELLEKIFNNIDFNSTIGKFTLQQAVDGVNASVISVIRDKLTRLGYKVAYNGVSLSVSWENPNE